MLKSFVENKHVIFCDSFDDWRDAIRAAAQPMIADGTIDDEYIVKLIKNVEEWGPYIIIAPNVAMPHSSVGTGGVHKTAIGFMKTKKPVVFDPEDESKNAQLFFTLAAVDNEQHLNNMMALSEMLMKDGIIEDLLNAKTEQDLLDINNKYSL
ncbi:MAG: PTS sugar transporter subunit IIA [Erysipelotrichaceae bacterium]|nr:PTS sugar transporter subunit IIA [Erysipelotrichaceae bacterium]